MPTKGCFSDQRIVNLDYPEIALEKIFAIGGKRGWYYADWLWNIRGFIDKMVCGIGIRPGRKNKKNYQLVRLWTFGEYLMLIGIKDDYCFMPR